MKLFEILVPENWPLKSHKLWDKKVIEITGGLSILSVLHGRWRNPKGLVEVEDMIPVRIAATDEQMERVAHMTRAHYDQYSVMYYVISPEVHIVSVV